MAHLAEADKMPVAPIVNFILHFSGVPIVFPVAGYFALTRTVTVAGTEVVDHQYMDDTM